MKVEAGRHHITRDGQVVGPIRRDSWTSWTDGTYTWHADGRYDEDMETPMDLIAVVQPPKPAADPLDAAPGPSSFVRETAARIMAAGYWEVEGSDADIARAAVRVAIALERALQEAGQ